MEGDSAQQHNQSSGTRHDSAGDAEDQELPGGNFSRLGFRCGLSSLSGHRDFVAMRVRKLATQVALEKQVAAHSRDQAAGENTKERVNAVWQNVFLSVEGYRSE